VRLTARQVNEKSQQQRPIAALYSADTSHDALRCVVSTSHGARSLFTALKSHYNRNTKGAVYLSTRQAQKELGSFNARIAEERRARNAQINEQIKRHAEELRGKPSDRRLDRIAAQTEQATAFRTTLLQEHSRADLARRYEEIGRGLRDLRFWLFATTVNARSHGLSQ
jgi:virulence-associated protein VapD